MENKNELIVNGANVETGEIVNTEIVVQETADYQIVKLPNGEFKKNMKYHEYFSRVAATEEEQIELYKVFNDSDSELVTPLSNMVNKEITIKHVFIQPYESFDEKTGNLTPGVTTTIESDDGSYYATSSKSVYYTIHNIMKTFGYPTDEKYKPVKVKVTGIKRNNGVQIDLTLVGIA
jgi:hypothetical protein